MATKLKTDKELNPDEVTVKQKSPYLFCDYCGFYPIAPVHGHFVCPKCQMATTCCEGAPLDV